MLVLDTPLEQCTKATVLLLTCIHAYNDLTISKTNLRDKCEFRMSGNVTNWCWKPDVSYSVSTKLQVSSARIEIHFHDYL